MSDSKTILITGASTGFGRQTAEDLARKGHTVYASMRGIDGKNKAHADELRKLATNENINLRVVEIDVTDEPQINAAVESIISEAGRLDVLINNAGIFGSGVLESYTTEQARWMFETNVFGPLTLSRAVLPQMRAQRSGLLIHVSSVVGRVVFPGFGLYASSKWALEALAESLRYEGAALGIDSVLVEPGAFKTEIFGKHFDPEDADRAADYGDLANVGETFGKGLEEYFASDAYRGPEAVVEAIVDLVESAGSRPARVVVGADGQAVAELNELAAKKQAQILNDFGMAPFAELAS